MAHGTCTVVFADKTLCGRRRKYAEWCNTCYQWSRNNGSVDPNGRKRKRGWGDLMTELQAAAKANTDRCIILGGHAGRPSVSYQGTRMAASRAVWIIAIGDPGDSHVLHTCHRGIEGCINIRHLYLGHYEENARDMVEAGRSCRGERNGTNELSPAQVQEIRQLIASGVPQRQIGKRYGVVQQTVSDINTGRIWSWLLPEKPKK